MKLHPYLNFAGNTEEVLNFYKDALNGEIDMVSRYGESPMPVDDDYKQKIMHSRLKFGDDNVIMMSDAMKGRPVNVGGNIQLSIGTHDEEKTKKIFDALSAGGTVMMPLAKQFWGATFGMLKDKFGVDWMLNCEEKK
jgi:PhnB protein